MKKRMVIQEHNAVKAGLHWDLRFEHNGVLQSWVIPKAHLPEAKQQLLAMEVADHPLSWGSFDGEIKEGYGKGMVKLIQNSPVNINDYTEKKITFQYEDINYVLYKAPFLKGKGTWLIKQKN
jgi:DNA ligase D-like protein (predicted 3'-phosphoesterase)